MHPTLPFIQKFLEMCSDDSFRGYHWIYPGMYQPLQAVATILVDLCSCPTSAEAADSRILVDYVFSMMEPDGGVVAEDEHAPISRQLSIGGKKAWDILRKMRRKAWARAGLDPHLVWLSSEGLFAGFGDHMGVDIQGDGWEDQASTRKPAQTSSTGCEASNEMLNNEQPLSKFAVTPQEFLGLTGEEMPPSRDASYYYAADSSQGGLGAESLETNIEGYEIDWAELDAAFLNDGFSMDMLFQHQG